LGPKASQALGKLKPGVKEKACKNKRKKEWASIRNAQEGPRKIEKGEGVTSGPERSLKIGEKEKVPK